jgi:hypothetical protein
MSTLLLTESALSSDVYFRWIVVSCGSLLISVVSWLFWLAPEVEYSGEVPIYYLFKNQKYKNSNFNIYIILCYICAVLFIVIREIYISLF